MKVLKRFKGLFPYFCGAYLLWLGLGLFGDGGSMRQPTPLPMILTKIQSLGELHTTKYTYNNVFEFASAREPAEWADRIPGMGSLVRTSTRNNVLVSAAGSVEAGVDLRSAEVAYDRGVDGATVLIVTLDPPKVYSPHVNAKIHNFRQGTFWHDSNIALKAQRDAARRMSAAAREQGILDAARESAAERLSELLKPITDASVEVRFRDQVASRA